MAFHIGQKVVCVRTCKTIDTFVSYNIIPPVVIGDVYTVGDIQKTKGGEIHLVLVELDTWFEGAPCEDGSYIKAMLLGYPKQLFKPLIERKTDIAVFEELLTPAPKIVEPA